jgi:hypothetical protein
MTATDIKSPMEQTLSSISLKSVVDGFKHYLLTYKKVIRYRGAFFSYMNSTEPSSLTVSSALAVYLYGVALSFVLYIPIILLHSLSLDKMHFLLQFIYAQFILVVLFYLSAKIFGGRGTFTDTAALYLTFSGMSVPLLLLLDFPLFIYIPTTEFVDVNATTNNLGLILANTPKWVQIWNGLVLLLMSVIAFILLLRWIADAHLISRRRLILSLIIIYMPLMAIHNLFLAPYAGKGIDLLSEALGKLG